MYVRPCVHAYSSCTCMCVEARSQPWMLPFRCHPHSFCFESIFISLCVYAPCVCWYHRRPEEGAPRTRPPRARVSGSGEPLDADAGTALESSARAISRAPIFLFEARSFTWPGTCQTGQTTWPAGTGCPLVSNVLALRFQVYLGLCCCFWFVCFFI